MLKVRLFLFLFCLTGFVYTKDMYLTLVARLDLDEIAQAGVDLKRARSEVIKSNLDIKIEKDNIALFIDKQNLKIKKILKDIEVLDEKYNYLKIKKDLFVNGDVESSGVLADYYENLNNSILNNISSIYTMRSELYENFSLYLQKLEGN